MAQDPLSDGTGDGFADRLTDGVGETDETEMTGENGDDEIDAAFSVINDLVADL